MVVIRREAGGSIDIFERGDRELMRIQQAIERGEEMIRKSLRTHPQEPESGEAAQPTPSAPPATAEKPVRKRVPEVRLRLEPPDRRGGQGHR